MPQFIIYDNLRCSKSRKTLDLLRSKGVEPKIIKYLKYTFSLDEINNILSEFKTSVREVLITCEPDFSVNGISDSMLSNDELIILLLKFQKVMECSILVIASSAIVWRPPGNVLKLLPN